MAGVPRARRSPASAPAARSRRPARSITALCTREERIAAFTVARVAINSASAPAGVVAGLIVASGTIRSFQIIYLLNAATFFGYLCFLAFVPDARPAHEGGREHGPRGYRFVLGHRAFLGVLAANFVFVVVGYTLFGYTMPIYARHHAHVGSQAIGAVFAANTIFIILFVHPDRAAVARAEPRDAARSHVHRVGRSRA